MSLWDPYAKPIVSKEEIAHNKKMDKIEAEQIRQIQRECGQKPAYRSISELQEAQEENIRREQSYYQRQKPDYKNAWRYPRYLWW